MSVFGDFVDVEFLIFLVEVDVVVMFDCVVYIDLVVIVR